MSARVRGGIAFTLTLALAIAACGGHPAPPPVMAVKKPPTTPAEKCAAGDGAGCADACREKVGGTSEVILKAIGPERGVEARALCDRGCELGDAGACGGAGIFRLFAVGGAVDAQAGVALLEKSCNAGSAKACANLGGVYVQGRFGIPADPKRGVALAERGCSQGYPFACVTVARIALGGFAGPEDDAAAERYASQACAGGEEGGCVILGILVQRGLRKPASDAERPEIVFERACAKDESSGCLALADRLYFGRGGESKDEKHGCDLFTRACDLGEADGCRREGYCYSRPVYGKVDLVKAGEAWAKACDGGSLASCSDLGEVYEMQGADVSHVPELYKRACDAHVVEACVNLARAYVNGVGVTVDFAKATTLFKAACAEQSARGCNGVAVLGLAAQGWPAKADAIRKTLDGKCKANDADACYALAVVTETSTETGKETFPADIPRAKSLLDKACGLKLASACLEKERLAREVR